MGKKNTIYLDHGATTPVRAEAVAAMLPYWTESYGNPSSHHAMGRAAAAALEKARQTVADLLHAQPQEIVFTANGSESDNLALRGAMLAARAAGLGDHLIVSAIEHSAVKGTAQQLADLFGFELTVLPVDEYGRISPDDLQAAIHPSTALISIMAASNEIGTLQPLADIGAIARRHGPLFHTDAIQAISSRQWDMAAQPIDLLSIAPHKFYGPKGVGILYVREGVDLVSPLTGGGQEDGRRAGTENVAFAVGAATALRLALAEREEMVAHYTSLRDRLIEGLRIALPGDARLTGHPVERLPHNASFAFRDVSGNDLLMHLDLAGIAASSGSACKSGNPKPSATLEALGLGPEWTKGGLRLTVGRQNTVAEIDYALETIVTAVHKLQRVRHAVR